MGFLFPYSIVQALTWERSKVSNPMKVSDERLEELAAWAGEYPTDNPDYPEVGDDEAFEMAQELITARALVEKVQALSQVPHAILKPSNILQDLFEALTNYHKVKE